MPCLKENTSQLKNENSVHDHEEYSEDYLNCSKNSISSDLMLACDEKFNMSPDFVNETNEKLADQASQHHVSDHESSLECHESPKFTDYRASKRGVTVYGRVYGKRIGSNRTCATGVANPPANPSKRTEK